MAMLWLAVVLLAMTVLIVAVQEISAQRTPILRRLPLPAADAELPSISLVAAARNEERNIEAAVRSLLAIEYPRLEITIVDDRSTDRTSEILRRLSAENARLNLVRIDELPAGWLGKNHALQSGVDRSRGEWILLTDADIVFERTALRRAIRWAVDEKIDHLAVTPHVEYRGWLLQAVVLSFILNFTLFVRSWAIRNPRSRAHVGIGAFNLVRGDVYRQIDGHRSIAMRPDDDLKLGKIIKQAGFSQALADGTEMVRVEWYASLGEMIRGMEKNAFASMDYSIVASVASTVVLLIANVWPFAAVVLVPGAARWLYVVDVMLLLALLARIARRAHFPVSCSLGYPVAVLLFVYIIWRTMCLNLWQGGIRWRDTFYPLSKLRANRI